MLASFNPLIKRLQHVHPLSSEEIQILENACSRTVQFGAHRDIIREGDQPEECHVLLDGFVCRYKLCRTATGRFYHSTFPAIYMTRKTCYCLIPITTSDP